MYSTAGQSEKLKMEAPRSSETSANDYQTIWCHIQHGGNLHILPLVKPSNFTHNTLLRLHWVKVGRTF